ncbi:hypothetical protein [Gilliamella sp. Occ4-3]|uniref:hypothetical protein n=1 Tax=Gilliamella sp. Occ4-3 TaxID=3120254 RepID=UPI00117BA0C7|nr:hypothetical protein [Gilliamella apicola]
MDNKIYKSNKLAFEQPRMFILKIAKDFGQIFRIISSSLHVKHYAYGTIIATLGIMISGNVIALSATTTKVIEGSAPYLQFKTSQNDQLGNKLKNLDELLGFMMPSQESTGELIQIGVNDSISNGGKPLTVPFGTKFSDVIALVTADGKEHTISNLQVADDDGDASITDNFTVGGTLTATWKDGSQVVSDLHQELTLCGGPYTLELSAQDIAATTKYGIPNKNYYGSKSKITYQFMLSGGPKLCYARPDGLDVYSEASDITKYPKGYNSALWSGAGYKEVNRFRVGFIAESFRPITGFKGIKFDLIGSGNEQSKYRCRLDASNINNWVTLSGNGNKELGKGCQVVYNSRLKPKTPLTINMEYTEDNGNSWKNIGKVTLPIPKKWAILIDHNKDDTSKGFVTWTGGSYPAFDECRKIIDGHAIPATTREQVNDFSDEGKSWRQKYMYRRNELINSLDADLPEGTATLPTPRTYRPSRDLGTFLGEWGGVYRYHNGGSFIWTSEMYRADKPFAVDGSPLKSWIIGDQYLLDNAQSSQTFCRGENLP